MATNLQDPKITQLVDRLNKASGHHYHLDWQDTADENMFRLKLPTSGMIRVGEEVSPVDGARTYTLWVLDDQGRVIEDYGVRPEHPDHAAIQELFRTARRSARGGQMLLDGILNQLPYFE